MAVTNIRKGIYETNSSSVHVLCINTKYDVNVPKSFTFRNGGQFGWSKDSYYDSLEKGQYLYIILKDYVEYKAAKEFEASNEYKALYANGENIYAIMYEFTNTTYNKIRKRYNAEYKHRIETILHEAGCCDIIWEDENLTNESYWLNGYIDHSYETYPFFEDMLNTPELLIHFLFGYSSIHTGNDNDADSYPCTDNTVDYIFEKTN